MLPLIQERTQDMASIVAAGPHRTHNRFLITGRGASMDVTKIRCAPGEGTAVCGTEEVSSVKPLHVLYLDYDGVLHPDSVYRTRNGIELLHRPGHSLFEHVPLLEAELQPYPEVKIVLSTSWLLIQGGYEHAKSKLSESLQKRCIGGTFHRREMRKTWFNSIPRPDQVIRDVERRQPARWIAIDDCPDDWPAWDHVVRADPELGIAASEVQEDLKAKLLREFGS